MLNKSEMIPYKNEGEEAQVVTPRTPSLAVASLIGGWDGRVRLRQLPCSLVTAGGKVVVTSHFPVFLGSKAWTGKAFMRNCQAPPKCLSHHAPDAQPPSPTGYLFNDSLSVCSGPGIGRGLGDAAVSKTKHRACTPRRQATTHRDTPGRHKCSEGK